MPLPVAICAERLSFARNRETFERPRRLKRLNCTAKPGKVESELDEVEPATEWEAWQMTGADAHSVVADPLFVDPEHGIFTLKPGSPALKLGFEPIPFDKIGPYQDPAGATWPLRIAEGVREHPQWLESVPVDKP
jgi:hypothetical protein